MQVRDGPATVTGYVERELVYTSSHWSLKNDWEGADRRKYRKSEDELVKLFDERDGKGF